MSDDPFDPVNLRASPDLEAQAEKQPTARKRGSRPRQTEPFTVIPHRDIVDGHKLLGGARLWVWVYLLHRRWADKRNTVTIGNQTLDAWGVGRKQKYEALRRLEEAGWISITQQPRCSPTVTLLRGRGSH